MIQPNSTCKNIFSAVDWFPTLCELAGIPVPRSIEGKSRALNLIDPGKSADPNDSAFIMNFSKYFDWFEDGAEWRGVRTVNHTYARWLDGREELYDLKEDPRQVNNLIEIADDTLVENMKALLVNHQIQRQDELVPCTAWKDWLDEQRRVIRNAFGNLSHPESLPDFSLLH